MTPPPRWHSNGRIPPLPTPPHLLLRFAFLPASMVRRTSLDTLSSFASTASEESDLDRTIPAAGEGAAGEADVGDGAGSHPFPDDILMIEGARPAADALPPALRDSNGRRKKAERRRSSIALAKMMWAELNEEGEATAAAAPGPGGEEGNASGDPGLRYPLPDLPPPSSELKSGGMQARRVSDVSTSTASASSAAIPLQESGGLCPPPAVDPTQLRLLMRQSQATLRSLQEYDRSQGLPTSHSHTMTQSERSRKQLLLGKILKKHDGSPLIRPDSCLHNGTVVFVGNKRRRAANAEDQRQMLIESGKKVLAMQAMELARRETEAAEEVRADKTASVRPSVRLALSA